jgi:lipopolysaccharide biosynthesis glycosyltransferase
VLRSLHPDWTAKFYVLTEGISEAAMGRLRKTLDLVGRSYELVEIRSPDTSVFKNLRPFHGSHAAYYRLLLPDYVTEKRFLYIDTDTVTTIDISPLFVLNMNGYPLGFVGGGTVKWSLENEFFISLGAKGDDPSFNSGVMLLDVEQWKSQNCFARLMEFCNAHPDHLISADQTALNALFAKDCYYLGPEYNMALSPESRRASLKNGIYHFVGSPKPWDLFGEFFHGYYSIWSDALGRIALGFIQRNTYTNIRNWRRFPHIIGGYRRILRQRYKLKREAQSRKNH